MQKNGSLRSMFSFAKPLFKESLINRRTVIETSRRHDFIRKSGRSCLVEADCLETKGFN